MKIIKNNGFTLIELLVVMMIIGILAAISIGSFQTSQTKARDAQRKNDLKQISSALEAYNNDRGEYPIHSLDYRILGCDDSTAPTACEWGEQWSDENATIYMAELPADPNSQLNYLYLSDGIGFQIYARLENDQDGSIPTSGGAPANYGVSCGELNCNYGVSSSNEAITSNRIITPD